MPRIPIKYLSSSRWLGLLVVLALLASPGIAHEASQAAQEGRRAPGSNWPLFIDDQFQPTIAIAWTQRDGTEVELVETLPWGSKTELADMGHNVLGFAAVGGTRIDLQQGHPLGSVVRVGFYKKDNGDPFFEDIKPGSIVRIRLEGVRFLEPASATTATTLHHLQYALEDVLNCGLDGSAIDQYNTANDQDTLGDQVTNQNGRPGVLRVVGDDDTSDAPSIYVPTQPVDAQRGKGPEERYATIRFEQDAKTGAIAVRAELPYELFRHVRDPWLRAEPGTFFEPTHFHLEFESLPVRGAPDTESEEAEGQAGP